MRFLKTFVQLVYMAKGKDSLLSEKVQEEITVSNGIKRTIASESTNSQTDEDKVNKIQKPTIDVRL